MHVPTIAFCTFTPSFLSRYHIGVYSPLWSRCTSIASRSSTCSRRSLRRSWDNVSMKVEAQSWCLASGSTGWIVVCLRGPGRRGSGLVFGIVRRRSTRIASWIAICPVPSRRRRDRSSPLDDIAMHIESKTRGLAPACRTSVDRRRGAFDGRI